MSFYNKHKISEILLFIGVFVALVFVQYSMAESMDKEKTFREGLFDPNRQIRYAQNGPEDTGKGGKTHKSSINAFLRVQNHGWPLVFEDEKLVNEIVSEINMIYSRFSKYELLHSPTTKSYVVNGDIVKSETYVSFSKSKGYRVPEQYVGEFGRLVEINGQEHIVVPMQLINDYRKAVELKTDNMDAYIKLGEFIAFIDNLDPSYAFDYETLVNMYYLDHLTKNQKNEILLEIKNDLPQIKNPFKEILYVKPSILDLYKGGSDGPFNGALLANVLVINRKTKNVIIERPLVYAGSRWKIIPVGS
jgi:hypothetical protein